ncbi:hypothetical protein PI125_g14341 [Phytophthora idaei]|nr:hypothetical protein PI125_g14341 [Phytophthora idaei]KAG3145952.1 hypothetical protein PI126_g13518 [Phytophthora idaei]
MTTEQAGVGEALRRSSEEPPPETLQSQPQQGDP